MSRRVLECTGLTVTVGSLVVLLHAVPQPVTARVAAAEAVTKTPWGDPDMQGIWTVEKLVPLERPDGVTKAFYTEEEVANLDRDRAGKSVFGNGVRQERGSEADVAGAYNSVFTSHAIDEVWITIGISMALVALVNFIFLGSLRAALIPSIVAPICLLATFIVLAPLGFSLNLLTLLALVLAIGLVVDDAIVVVENIQRRLDHGEPQIGRAHV